MEKGNVNFSIYGRSKNSPEELEEKITEASLNPESRTKMSDLLLGGYSCGALIGMDDGDGGQYISTMRKLQYMSFVQDTIGVMPESLRPLAIDLSLISYQYGLEYQKRVPDFFRNLETAIGEPSAQSLFDVAKEIPNK